MGISWGQSAEVPRSPPSQCPRPACGALSIRHYGFIDSYLSLGQTAHFAKPNTRWLVNPSKAVDGTVSRTLGRLCCFLWGQRVVANGKRMGDLLVVAAGG